MKTFTKSLTLLLAGLLAASTLTSCASETNAGSPAAGEPAATTTESTVATTTAPVTTAPVTCLSPAQLMRKLKNATELTYCVTQLDTINGKEYEFTEIVNLKSNKVMITFINDDPYGNHSEKKTYYDLENGQYYEKDDNGRWTVSATDVKWEWIVNGWYLDELLDPNNMKKKGDHYEFPAAKAREWRDRHGFDGDVSVKLSEKNGFHILAIEYLNNSDGDEQTETFTFRFESSAVRLPKVAS